MWLWVILWNTISTGAVEEAAEISLNTQSHLHYLSKHTQEWSAECGWHCGEHIRIHTEICATELHMAEGVRWSGHERSRLIGPAGAAMVGRRPPRSLSLTEQQSSQVHGPRPTPCHRLAATLRHTLRHTHTKKQLVHRNKQKCEESLTTEERKPKVVEDKM